MKLIDLTYALTDAIKVTPEFTHLKQSKAIIDKNEALKKRIIEFNKKQVNLYSGRILSKEAEQMAKELEENYRDLSKIKEIGDYLKASKQFNDLLNTVYKAISDSIEKEIKFI